MRRIKRYFGDNLEHVVVCQENHKTGDKHLHVLAKLKEKVNFKNPRWADVFTGKHGRYEGVRSHAKTLKYVVKEGNFVHYGISEEEIHKIIDGGLSVKWATAWKYLKEGKSIAEICDLQPQLYVPYIQKLRVAQLEACNLGALVSSSMSVRSETTKAMQIAGWLNLWFEADCRVKSNPLRTKQLWLWGPHGVGKSTFAAALQERVRTFLPEPFEDFYDGFSSTFDLILYDEFTGRTPVTRMNTLADGHRTKLRQKGSQVIKTRNIPLIVLSNYPPEEIYPDDRSRTAMISRFLIVHIENVKDIPVFIEDTANP
jgi:hypothetical protein